MHESPKLEQDQIRRRRLIQTLEEIREQLQPEFGGQLGMRVPGQTDETYPGLIAPSYSVTHLGSELCTVSLGFPPDELTSGGNFIRADIMDARLLEPILQVVNTLVVETGVDPNHVHLYDFSVRKSPSRRCGAVERFRLRWVMRCPAYLRDQDRRAKLKHILKEIAQQVTTLLGKPYELVTTERMRGELIYHVVEVKPQKLGGKYYHHNFSSGIICTVNLGATYLRDDDDDVACRVWEKGAWETRYSRNILQCHWRRRIPLDLEQSISNQLRQFAEEQGIPRDRVNL